MAVKAGDWWQQGAVGGARATARHVTAGIDDRDPRRYSAGSPTCASKWSSPSRRDEPRRLPAPRLNRLTR